MSFSLAGKPLHFSFYSPKYEATSRHQRSNSGLLKWVVWHFRGTNIWQQPWRPWKAPREGRKPQNVPFPIVQLTWTNHLFTSNFPSLELCLFTAARRPPFQSDYRHAALLVKFRTDGSGLRPLPLRGREWRSLAAAIRRQAISRSRRRVRLTFCLPQHRLLGPPLLQLVPCDALYAVVSAPFPAPSLPVTFLTPTVFPHLRGVVCLILFSIILSSTLFIAHTRLFLSINPQTPRPPYTHTHTHPFAATHDLITPHPIIFLSPLSLRLIRFSHDHNNVDLFESAVSCQTGLRLHFAKLDRCLPDRPWIKTNKTQTEKQCRAINLTQAHPRHSLCNFKTPKCWN